MENIPISSLPLRIGYPYLFRHIESCDHMIILNDIREIDKYDNFKIENGKVEKKNIAIVTYQKKVKRRKCDACLFYPHVPSFHFKINRYIMRKIKIFKKLYHKLLCEVLILFTSFIPRLSISTFVLYAIPQQ